MLQRSSELKLVFGIGRSVCWLRLGLVEGLGRGLGSIRLVVGWLRYRAVGGLWSAIGGGRSDDKDLLLGAVVVIEATAGKADAEEGKEEEDPASGIQSPEGCAVIVVKRGIARKCPTDAEENQADKPEQEEKPSDRLAVVVDCRLSVHSRVKILAFEKKKKIRKKEFRLKLPMSKGLHYLTPSGHFPNNELEPTTFYSSVFPKDRDSEQIASDFETLFSANGWGQSWRDIIYPYQHYHSTAYEVLGVFSGHDRVRLGGDDPDTTVTIDLQPGDALLIPPGVAHISLGRSEDFSCVGAYPLGQDPDLLLGKPEELQQARENIRNVPQPPIDPVLSAPYQSS